MFLQVKGPKISFTQNPNLLQKNKIEQSVDYDLETLDLFSKCEKSSNDLKVVRAKGQKSTSKNSKKVLHFNEEIIICHFYDRQPPIQLQKQISKLPPVLLQWINPEQFKLKKQKEESVQVE